MQTYVSPNNMPSEASTSNTKNTIADAAQKYIGTPYVWGGESMDEGGMDCSGFVYNALKDAGYDVGRTTAQGYRGYGNSVSKSDMQPGDLIFYGKNGEASHIGIYIGNGQMVHSSGGSKNTKANPGKGVTVANVDHRSDFIEARRY
jgi:cell wall-associated NlpC family hydrolase